MPFSGASLSLADILDAILAIEQFTQDMELDSFRQDSKTIAAVERKLQVISEAAVRLGEQAEALCPLCRMRHKRHYAESQPMPSTPAPMKETSSRQAMERAVQLTLF